MDSIVVQIIAKITREVSTRLRARGVILYWASVCDHDLIISCISLRISQPRHVFTYSSPQGLLGLPRDRNAIRQSTSVMDEVNSRMLGLRTENDFGDVKIRR